MLGIWFSYDEAEIIDLNFNEINGNMKKQLDIWRSRNISLKGKLIILKTLILHQILYLFNLIYVLKSVLDKIYELFVTFLLNSKPSKVYKIYISCIKFQKLCGLNV